MNSPEILSIIASRYSTAGDLHSSDRDTLPTPQKDFKTARLGKLKLNSQQEIKSAKLFINKNRVIIRNLAKLEPLSHLIDEEKLSSLLIPNTTKEFTTLSHLRINKNNVTNENFLIKRNKPKKKSQSNPKHLTEAYKEQPIDKGFKIKTITPIEENKTKRKITKQFATLKKVTSSSS